MRKNVAKNYILQAKCHFYPESYIGKQTKLNLACMPMAQHPHAIAGNERRGIGGDKIPECRNGDYGCRRSE